MCPTWSGGVPAWSGGVYLPGLRGGCTCHSRAGCLSSWFWGGVPGLGGVPAFRGEGCTCPGGCTWFGGVSVPAWSGGGVWSHLV